MKHFKFQYDGGYITAAAVAETVEEALQHLHSYPSIAHIHPDLWELIEAETFEVAVLEANDAEDRKGP